MFKTLTVAAETIRRTVREKLPAEFLDVIDRFGDSYPCRTHNL